MKSRKKPRSMTAITCLLALSIGLTWLVSMFYLTMVAAQEIFDRLTIESHDFLEYVERLGEFQMFYDKGYSRYGLQYERPDFLEYGMLTATSITADYSLWSSGEYGSYNSGKFIRSIKYPMETAVLFYDGDGNLLHSSGEDIMFFSYYTQEEWDAGADCAVGLHYGWIDISEGKDAEDWQDDPWLRFRVEFSNNLHSLRGFRALKVTGVFDGCELKPVSMYYVTDTQIYQVLESTDQFTTEDGYFYEAVSELDRTGLLEWQLQFDHSAEYAGSGLVTVYTDRPEMWDYEGTPLTYGGEEYESLAALTDTLDVPTRQQGSLRGLEKYELNELLVFGVRQYADYQGFDYESGGEPETEFIMVTAIRSHPLACAVSALRNIYVTTALLALVLLLAVRGGIKKHLVDPVAEITGAMEGGWKNRYRPEYAPTMWLEAAALDAEFSAEQDWRRRNANEINRLSTALDYATAAEQNRRQMTSNIAHELKTPLAVIHSYAEGLKEHIAEDKRDKYLDVILSETERTDGIVLEMLDLSRLEAGRVKLARDDFSLAALTRSIFEKLEIAVRAKGLRIDYQFPKQCTVTADENRIGQVIENFATNAIKYTPTGGQIVVRIQSGAFGTAFTMENESAPLSREALEKVWETFYRTDESRSSGGTGLGLAIAKNIIELHGGKCSVRNTKTGVEFGFTLL